MNPLGYAVARPILETVIDTALGFSHQPLPMDAPRVTSYGPDADRLLLIGTAAVAGVGVASHQLALGGQLARAISAVTERGVAIDIEGSPALTAVDAIRSLTGRVLTQYDAVVLVLGSRECMGFQPMRQWKPRLRDLLSTIVETDAAVHVFVVAIPSIDMASLPSALSLRIALQLERQNQVTASVCAEMPRASYLPLIEAVGALPEAPTGSQLNSTLYQRLAGTLAPPLAEWLDGNAHQGRSNSRVDEPTRQNALDALQVVDSDPDVRYDNIARTARDLLGASGASVTFLDHDRQWIKSAISMSDRDTARANAFCNTTITGPDVFVVEDAAADDSFAGHPWVIGREGVRFYAGYPLEAPGGERVGALCIVDTKPRRFSGAEAAVLRELALRVQGLLWAR